RHLLCFMTLEVVRRSLVVGSVRRMSKVKRSLLLISLATLTVATGCMLAGANPSVVGAAPARLNAVTVTFASTSGSNIHGWYAPGKPGAGAGFLLHRGGEKRTPLVGRAGI